MAWYVEHRGEIRANLSGLPVSEIRPQEKGGSTAANPTTGAEMAADYDRLGHCLPESEGKTTISVFVDRLSKMFTLLHARRKYQRKNTPSSSSIMCLNIMVYRK